MIRKTGIVSRLVQKLMLKVANHFSYFSTSQPFLLLATVNHKAMNLTHQIQQIKLSTLAVTACANPVKQGDWRGSSD